MQHNPYISIYIDTENCVSQQVYGVALGWFYPESQGGYLSFEVTGRERGKGDKGSWHRWRIKGSRSKIVDLASSFQIRIKEQCSYMMKDSAVWDPWNNDSWYAAVPILNARTPRVEPEPKYNWDFLWSEVRTVPVRPRRFITIVRLILFKYWFKPIQTHYYNRSGTTNNRGCANLYLGKKCDVNCDVQGYICSFWVMIDYKEYWGAKDRDSGLVFQGKEWR